MASKGGLKQIVSLVSPPEGDWIAAFRVFYIVISSGAVADIVGEFVGAPELEAGWMPVVLGFAEHKILLLGWFELA